MELTEDLPEVFVDLKHDDETDGPVQGLLLSLLNNELMITVVDGAWRIDATTLVICCTTSDNKRPVKDELVHVDMEISGMDNSDAAAEVARG